ncbi:enterochelin esterase domain-containing protein [Shigella flexneri]
MTKCLRSLSGGVIPQVLKNTSTIKRVWVYITGVTNHHQNGQPQSMQPIAGTNVWQWKTNSMPTGAAATALFPPNAMTFSVPSPIASNCAKAGENYYPGDSHPLNLQSWKGGRGHAVSALEMPQRLCNRDGIRRKREKYLPKKLSGKVNG